MTLDKLRVAVAFGYRNTVMGGQAFTLYYPHDGYCVSFFSDEAPDFFTETVKKHRLITFDAPEVLRNLGKLPQFELIDLKTEFRWLINGSEQSSRTDLSNPCLKTACRYFDLSDAAHELKLYIESDTQYVEKHTRISEFIAKTLWQLYLKMEDHLNIDFALERGQFIQVQSRIESRGIPLDQRGLRAFQQYFDQLFETSETHQSNCLQFFLGTQFSATLLESYITRKGIPWPTKGNGQYLLDKDTICDMSDAHPDLSDLKELYKLSLTAGNIEYLIDHDGKNRVPLNAFKTSTGRNAPGKGFILNQPKQLRRYITPPEGQVIIGMDYAQQEFAIAAALSGDPQMIEDYETGDVYLAFAENSGALLPSMTPEEIAKIRKRFKQTSLAVLYGMSAKGLACRLCCTEKQATDLLKYHKSTYTTFWSWIEHRISQAWRDKYMQTDFGWRLHVFRNKNGFTTKNTTLKNWLMQTTGAEMTRRALMLAESKGLYVIASNHDAIYIQSPASDQKRNKDILQACMEQASWSLIPTIGIRTDFEIIPPLPEGLTQ